MPAAPLARFAAVAVLLFGSIALADAPAAVPPPAKDQAALDKEFSEKLTNVQLVGTFTMRDGEQKKDSYTIIRAVRGEGDEWVITAKIEYKGLALPIDMKLPVKWAGDTPVISLTNKAIPGFGVFTARVMFYGDEYAGTWAGGKNGGLMFGKIVKIAAETTKPAKP